MIKTREMTPRVLSKDSRDFQFVSTLLDLVANSLKLDIDYFTNQVDINKVKSAQLREAASLVGWHYDDDLTPEQNRVMISNFRALNQFRGSLRGFELAILVYGQLKGIDVKYVSPRLIEEGVTVMISIQDFNYEDLALISKVMEIVRPVGTRYLVVNSTISEPTSTTAYHYDDQVLYYSKQENETPIAPNGEVATEPESNLAQRSSVQSNSTGRSSFVATTYNADPESIEEEMSVVGHSIVTDEEGEVYEEVEDNE